ncbi:hypothetical protein SAMN05421553_3540 [Pseudomonas anguilliseptica]|uniref:Uncharacterized protein n=1 Tax=Pseudomonas anguilliseptica TaxID=53406 RepID=A0A1H5EA10_PSEAG|nr:hypothetical protein SAMN05421553_3540 [Pseudomonas anguilliseptica]
MTKQLASIPTHKPCRIVAGLLLSMLLLPLACSASPIGTITRIHVQEQGIGPPSEGCAKFVIEPAQVQAFFARAVLISARQQHDFFLYGPCTARGTLQTRYGQWHWVIRNLGTATLTASNGDTFLLGDPGQESDLSGD